MGLEAKMNATGERIQKLNVAVLKTNLWIVWEMKEKEVTIILVFVKRVMMVPLRVL